MIRVGRGRGVAADAAGQSTTSSGTSRWQSRPRHPADATTRCSPGRATSAREVMRSTTAVQRRRRPGSAPDGQQTCWPESHEAVEPGPKRIDSLLTHGCRLSPRSWAAFSLVRCLMVGLGGLEPPTSSLSGFCPRAFYAGWRLQPGRPTHRLRPLETVANRSAPMACGPNVDQTATAQRSGTVGSVGAREVAASTRRWGRSRTGRWACPDLNLGPHADQW
jgi:hypothetical protein